MGDISCSNHSSMYHLNKIYLSSVFCELKIDLKTKSGPLSYQNMLILPKLQLNFKKTPDIWQDPVLKQHKKKKTLAIMLKPFQQKKQVSYYVFVNNTLILHYLCERCWPDAPDVYVVNTFILSSHQIFSQWSLTPVGWWCMDDTTSSFGKFSNFPQPFLKVLHLAIQNSQPDPASPNR